MDFKTRLDQLMAEIETDPTKISDINEDIINNMSEDQLNDLYKKVSPYGRTIEGSNKIICMSVTNLRDDYMRKFHMTALVGFMYRMAEEYLTEEYTSEVFVRRIRFGAPRIDFTNDDFITLKRFYNDTKFLKHYLDDKFPITQLTNIDEMFGRLGDTTDLVCIFEESDEQFNLRKNILQNEYDNLKKAKRSHIKEFLDSMFEFNPDKHVRRAKEKLVKADLANDASAIVQSATEIPLDTFHRYKFYTDVNYEKIMNTVSVLYSVQPDIHYAVNPYEVFDDSDKETAQQKADKFISKHQRNVITDILCLTTGKWNLIGPFSKNRERVNFLNDNTKIIEGIFKQSEIDSQLGEDLMKKRVLLKKKENASREGAVHPNFLAYSKENISAAGASASEVSADKIKHAEELRTDLKVVDELDALEVKVITLDPGNKTVSTSYFHTQAEAPTPMSK